ncbi:MAG: ABC transporter permease [Bacteroidales bacterium]|nr:ABC transporter permease [Bacteroidales bacterium]
MKRHLHNINSAVEAVFANKFRSILTALGIIFGVAAVIAMMAIGKGAQQEILEQIRMVGVNNIVITPKLQEEEDVELTNDTENSSSEESTTSGKNFSPGLTLSDAESFFTIIPDIELISPEVVFNAPVVKSGTQRTAKFSGVTPAFFQVFNIELLQGEMFNDFQLENGQPVCIIGPEIRARFFKQESPIGKRIKCGNIWLEVIGVLKSRMVSETANENLGVSEFNNTVFVPIKTILLRYKDRSLITKASLSGSDEGNQSKTKNPNQLDKIIIQVKESEQLVETAGVVKRMLQRRHAGQEDFEIKIPELLLKQQQRTKDIFNIVLGAIASISLIVGGIGIMNIMLASVMERIREIGVRMAMGARKSDIIFQFVAEATLISISGGFIGVILGVVLAKVIMQVTGILTIVSLISIVISFGVSATVGIVFGLMPARTAAHQDPVTSLRHD